MQSKFAVNVRMTQKSFLVSACVLGDLNHINDASEQTIVHFGQFPYSSINQENNNIPFIVKCFNPRQIRIKSKQTKYLHWFP